MCGEIESEAPIDRQVVGRFRDLAQRYVDHAAEAAGRSGEAHSAHAYMDRLFGAVLGRCVQDLDQAGDAASLEQLRAQAIVLARLSGLLAGQLPPELDGLPAAMDAMLVGYRETGQAPDPGHDHHHHHH
jgi:hypothetical protein